MTRKDWLNGLWLALSGLGLGWLIGLSVSPVIQGVITGLITVVVSIATLLAGVHTTQESEPGKSKLPIEVAPFPVACLILAIALGASIGVYARTHRWLGDSALAGSEAQKTSEPALFASVPAEECVQLKAAPDDQLERVMARSSNPRVRRFAEKCTGQPTCLRAAVEELICASAK
jgi:hypothetical protein